MTLPESHKENISEGLRRRWAKKKQVDVLKDEVINLARRVAYNNGDKRNLQKAIEDLDHALASH